MLVAILFSMSGSIMTNENFHISLENEVEKNTKQHILERYSMEAGVRNALENGKLFSSELLADCADKFAAYGNVELQMAIYLDEATLAYDNLNPSISKDRIKEYLEDMEDTYIFEHVDDKTYMILASSISVSNQVFTVVNAFHISSIFKERDRQFHSFLLLNLVVIFVSVVGAFVISWLLTASIKKLNVSSKRIAAGKYSERSRIRSTDEIGELSHSFDCMAQKVEEHIESLNAEIKVREEFISDFSHELKTPMTAIMGYSKMLATSECDHLLQKKSADYIYRECKRLELLSKRLLQLMGISEESVKLIPVSACWVAEEVQKFMLPVMADVKLESEVEEAKVFMDSSLLMDLFRNLIENAKRSNPSDQVVRLNGKRKDGKYLFSVKDKGCGMAKEAITHATEAFYRADKSRSRSAGGNGLGLTICHKICQCHKTNLVIESEPGLGTCVSFILEVYNETLVEE
jgi:signal transduction histidine kinase